MAVNEIILVANRNGHRHVIVRWGHGLLREGERGKKRDTDTSLIRLKIRFRTTAVSKETKEGLRVKEWTQKERKRRDNSTLQEHKGI